MFAGQFKEQVRGALAENVENDLHRLDVWKFDGLDGFLDFFNADAVMPEFSGRDEVVQNLKNFGHVINLGGRAMELEQIQSFGFEVAQTAFDERRQVFAAVALGSLFAQTPAGLGGDVEWFFSFFF